MKLINDGPAATQITGRHCILLYDCIVLFHCLLHFTQLLFACCKLYFIFCDF